MGHVISCANSSGSTTTLFASFIFGASAMTINPGRSNQTAVLLGPNFFSNPANQGNSLLHEGLHAFSGWNDNKVFSMFANQGLQHQNYGTGDISKWIGTDCYSTPK